MILFASLAVLLLVPFAGISNADKPIELSDEIKQKIKDRIPPHQQGHVEKIFKLAQQKSESTSDSKKQELQDLIDAEEKKMGETREKNKKHSMIQTNLILPNPTLKA